MAPKSFRSRGFTLIEGIIATFILTIVVVAMFATWSACYKQSAKISEITEAANIAQSELEIAKVYGAANLPLGQYQSSSQTGTWTGAYIPSTGWTSGATAYYNYTGVQLASSNSPGVFFSVSMALTDSSILANNSGNSYTLAPTSIRAAVVTVRNVSSGAVDFTMATNLVQGGL